LHYLNAYAILSYREICSRFEMEKKMNTDLTKIKARIRALAAKTVANGCTEQEAMSAMTVVGKLLQEYNLSMDMVDLHDEACTKLEIQANTKQNSGVYYALAAIAKFTDCKVWSTKSSDLTYSFFGQESDLLMAKYLYDLVNGSIKFETKQFKKTPEYKNARTAKGASSAFAMGMGARIGKRLTQMKIESEQEATASRGGNTALIVLKSKLVTEEFAKMKLHLSKAGKTSVRDTASYYSGAAAGDRVNLSRPVNGPGGQVFQIAC
jgi:hypothetical protein